MDKESCLIKKEDNKLYIYVYDTKNGIYVNNFIILKKAEIKIGDVIFIVGLRIMVSMTTNNGFALYVNNGTINSINTNMIPLGMIGSIIPILVVVFGYKALYDYFGGILFSPVIKLVAPMPFVINVSVIILIIGMVVGMIGSGRAVRRYVRE